jgi:hypothetical protein
MPLFTASTRHLYRILLVCLVYWNASVHGQPAEAAVQLDIAKPKLDFLKQPQHSPRPLGLARCNSRSTPMCIRWWTLWLAAEPDRTMLCRELRQWRLRW